ncbi:RNA polymerase sigma factor [Terriglobus aquaticus]|uniref:RNA polymerase sigma factor n=1 Tax=Terriglobus aquaticus TaxID=940139 RepID=A0ABW9KFT5_9BACT|nr:sigma-70 family RNA polymerase sigma factor [Terriglobus aquaticus]
MTRAEGYSLVLSVGERAAAEVDIAALVQRHATLLFRVAHSVLRNPHEAEDVVQDTFVRVLQHRHDLPAVREKRVWLVRIAWNLAVDRTRRIRPESMDAAFAESLSATLVPADRAMDEAERLRRVLRAVDALPRTERAALLLSAVDEMSTAEVAAVLRKSESAVRAMLFRARGRLKQRLAEMEKKGVPR